MSANPSPNTTPPPPPGVGGGGGGPSPSKIGQAFIKQYYKILLTAPSQLNRFYQPDSTVSRGMEPSAPATPSPFNLAASGGMNGGTDDSPGERVRKAFFDWAGVGAGDNFAHTEDILRIDFERGAIDAQESIGGGILLVVTGHMFLPGQVKPSAFVHTFFLNNNAGPGRKKQFLVKNDILRFLEPVAANEEEVLEAEVQAVEEEIPSPVIEEAPAAVVVAVIAKTPAPVLAQDPILASSPLVVEPIPLVPVEYEPSADEEKVEEDDEVEEPVMVVQHEIVDVEPATEEEKIDAIETSSAGSDASPTELSPSSDGKKKRNRKKRGVKSRSRSNSPKKEDTKEETPEKPKTPGSWASLVASGGSGAKSISEGGKKGGRRNSPKASRGGTGSVDKSSSNNPDTVKSPPPQSKEPSTPVATPTPTPASVTPQPQPISQQRKPEATLFIRNIPDKTTQEEIRTLFEPHGLATGNKILGITLNPNRGFCFVDFDGAAAVIAIVAEAATSLVKDPRTGRKCDSSFMVHGRVLEVERKVPSNKSGGGSGGSSGRRFNRSHSPKDGGGRYRGSRGSGGGGGGGGGGMRRSPPQVGGGGGNR